MREHWFSYAFFDENENCFFTTGITFKDFINSMSPKPTNLLIIDGSPDHAKYVPQIGMWVVDSINMEDFIHENVYSFGDFCWVDYRNEDNVENMPREHVAELLYASRIKSPLAGYTWDSLNNRFLYLGHDDSYWVKVYLKQNMDYMHVIENKIMNELKGRRNRIEQIPEGIKKELFEYCKCGLVFDFENGVFSGPTLGIPLYQIGNVELSIDKIHERLDQAKRVPSKGLFLEYSSRSKDWKIY